MADRRTTYGSDDGPLACQCSGMAPERRRAVARQSYDLQETVTDPFFRCVN